jgi:asparagine synthase (glutamine-hydrolysing)
LCGIIGIWAKNNKGEEEFVKMPSALKKLAHRGPDNQTIKTYSKVCFGHARLSVIDPHSISNQPMSDPSNRYHLVHNGEIYNYLELRQSLEREGITFSTHSDTEVLLHLLITKGEKALDKLNGFFSFVFYDSENDRVIFARDRLGIKPLVFYEDESKIILTSELQTLFEFDIEKEIDPDPLNLYLRLTYVPAPSTMLKRAYKIMPGQMGIIDHEGLRLENFYTVKRQAISRSSFHEAAEDLRIKLTLAVKDRLVSDVSLGSFLSGGLDSSLIAAIAKRHKEDLKTFSIGFDHPYFNESEYARKVANHIKSDHHEFILGQNEFQENFYSFLDAIDEPFGDSSAFAVYLLAKKTKEHVTVALSGDGADELFGGYRKQRAELYLRQMSSSRKSGLLSLSKIMKKIKVSRSDKIGDFNRKIQKMSRGVKMNDEERYFEWCSFVDKENVFEILQKPWQRDSGWNGTKIHDISDYLIADQEMILPNDMLKKVDLMSMRHALEVRTPFLDHRVVEFANSLPIEYKMNLKVGKMVLKKAASSLLPDEILGRRKQGFEIPLQEWLGAEMEELLNSEIFSKSFIDEQNIFEYKAISKLVKTINSKTFGEKIYLVWSLIIFQHWYKKYYC